MDVITIISSAAISAVVSGGISYSIKTALKSAIENHYKTELEKLKSKHSLEIESLKAQLVMMANLEREFTSRKLVSYPKMISLVYRIRNTSRDINKGLSVSNLSMVEDLALRVRELEEALYEFRFDLQRDHVFNEVHNFKNIALSFSIVAAKAKFFIYQNDNIKAEEECRQLNEVFSEIEQQHLAIIDSLTTHVSVPQDSNK